MKQVEAYIESFQDEKDDQGHRQVWWRGQYNIWLTRCKKKQNMLKQKGISDIKIRFRRLHYRLIGRCSHEIVEVFSVLIGLIAAAGCASTRFVLTGNRYSKWDGPVKVLREFPENEEYEEVEWISVKIDKEFDDILDWGDILVALQNEARKRGANAIVIVERDIISAPTYHLTRILPTKKQ